MRRGDSVMINDEGYALYWFRSGGLGRRLWLVCEPNDTSKVCYPRLVDEGQINSAPGKAVKALPWWAT